MKIYKDIITKDLYYFIFEKKYYELKDKIRISEIGITENKNRVYIGSKVTLKGLGIDLK